MDVFCGPRGLGVHGVWHQSSGQGGGTSVPVLGLGRDNVSVVADGSKRAGQSQKVGDDDARGRREAEGEPQAFQRLMWGFGEDGAVGRDGIPGWGGRRGACERGDDFSSRKRARVHRGASFGQDCAVERGEPGASLRKKSRRYFTPTPRLHALGCMIPAQRPGRLAPSTQRPSMRISWTRGGKPRSWRRRSEARRRKALRPISSEF